MNDRNDVKVQYGKILRMLHLKSGLTLAMLAEKANLSENYIRRIEKGLCCPSFEKFVYICNGFEISMVNFVLNMENNQCEILQKTSFVPLDKIEDRIEIMKMILGDYLLGQRRKKRMTQIKLAKNANLNKTYYGFIERAVANPTLKKLFQLCDALEITFLDMILYIEEKLK